MTDFEDALTALPDYMIYNALSWPPTYWLPAYVARVSWWSEDREAG